MTSKEGNFYFLPWKFIPSVNDLLDTTQGNELVEISIQDIDQCRPASHYTLPILQAGQSFALIRANLMYPKDRCSKPLRHIFISIRITRGPERRLIYTNDYFLPAPHYANGTVCRIPIYRVWHLDDYVRWFFKKVFL